MILLIIGSGPAAVEARAWARSGFDKIAALNNAWRIRDDWDYLVYPYDFPSDRMPEAATGTLIDQTHFVPAQNAFGGFAYGGATMAFTAAYWALHALKPRVMAFVGCDMVYPTTGATHFYGAGTADPLRDDFSLRDLEAKSARVMCYAARQGCAAVNLSQDESRLIFPRTDVDTLSDVAPQAIDAAAMGQAEALETALGYTTPTGFHAHITPELDQIDALDLLWKRAARVA